MLTTSLRADTFLSEEDVNWISETSFKRREKFKLYLRIDIELSTFNLLPIPVISNSLNNYVYKLGIGLTFYRYI